MEIKLTRVHEKEKQVLFRMLQYSLFEESIMSFANYVPFIVVSLAAGTFVDRYDKKRIMIILFKS